MRKIFILITLILFSIDVNAMCMRFYYDKDGQSHGAKCGAGLPEQNCEGYTYWDGRQCIAIQIIQSCIEQGGKWQQVQFRVSGIQDVLDDVNNIYKNRYFYNVCVCPNKGVWDGKKCRYDIPREHQCTNYAGDGTIRYTEELYGSVNCPRF